MTELTPAAIQGAQRALVAIRDGYHERARNLIADLGEGDAATAAVVLGRAAVFLISAHPDPTVTVDATVAGLEQVIGQQLRDEVDRELGDEG